MAVGMVALFAIGGAPAHAQSPPPDGPTRSHPPVCGKGVRTYADLNQVRAPFDSMVMPPSSPVRVTNSAEAEAADRAMHERAGTVGATGVVVAEVTEENGDGMVIRRRAVPVFVPSDSARAQQACK